MVTALADDLRRSLRHETMSARPDTLRYRTTKFVRRHVRGVAMTAAILVLLSGVTGFYTTRLATERDRARREADKAAKVSELLTGLLTGADPCDPRDPRGTDGARAARRRRRAGSEGARRAARGAGRNPDGDGRIYRRLGVYDKARPLLEEALALGRPVFGPEHVRVAQSLNDLGVLLSEMGDYAGAGPSLEQALSLRRKLLGKEHADVAITLVELGRVYQDQGFNRCAEPLQREALEIRRKLYREQNRDVATS